MNIYGDVVTDEMSQAPEEFPRMNAKPAIREHLIAARMKHPACPLHVRVNHTPPCDYNGAHHRKRRR